MGCIVVNGSINWKRDKKVSTYETIRVFSVPQIDQLPIIIDLFPRDSVFDHLLSEQSFTMSMRRAVSSNLRNIDNTFIRNLRDQRKRESAKRFEVERRAYLFVARNTSLPATVRHKAQLGLNALNNGEGRLTAVKNRCIETGRGRGESSICMWWSGIDCFIRRDLQVWPKSSTSEAERFDEALLTTLQYQFRMRALADELPGVHKSSW